MMREIKFRLVITEKRPPYWKESIRYRYVTLNDLLSQTVKYPAVYLISDYEIHGGIYIKAKDQYTGFEDRNGREIYEDDIVRHKHGQGRVFSRLGCWFIESYKELGYTMLDTIEVIENPELLKEVYCGNYRDNHIGTE